MKKDRPAPKPVTVGKAMSGSEWIKSLPAQMKKRQEEWDKLSPEEQAERTAKAEDALRQLRGKPGFSVFTIKK